MATCRFKFETTEDSRTRGIEIEGPSFTLALEQASENFRAPVMDIEHIRTQRLEFGEWITIFDPFRGIV